MNMYELIKNSGLHDLFVKPFLDLINDLGLENKVIKLGFGSVEWINFELYDLVSLILNGLMVWFVLYLVYKIIKIILSLMLGVFRRLR